MPDRIARPRRSIVALLLALAACEKPSAPPVARESVDPAPATSEPGKAPVLPTLRTNASANKNEVPLKWTKPDGPPLLLKASSSASANNADAAPPR